jgi:pimeloyl-ACP methyl ester carboxylesterase
MHGIFSEREGRGPRVLLVHGTAADHRTWSIQRLGLRNDLELLVYDRRGTGRSPLPPGQPFVDIPGHAADAAGLIREFSPGEPVLAVGSSFGGVVLLELLRTAPALVRTAVLLEPPLPPSETGPLVAPGFVEAFHSLWRADGGRAAAEFFLRTVLGDRGYERMPLGIRERALAEHDAIRQDCEALVRYRFDDASLSAVTTPVVLVGGERSPPFYRPALERLAAALGNATVETLAGAGHMMHAEAYRRFNARLRELAAGPGAGAGTASGSGEG